VIEPVVRLVGYVKICVDQRHVDSRLAAFMYGKGEVDSICATPFETMKNGKIHKRRG
jgi:hypothetical protein